MEFKHNNKTFILCELKEPNKNISYDVIAIFEEEEGFKYKFINYFYGVEDSKEALINISIKYIDDFYKNAKKEVEP